MSAVLRSLSFTKRSTPSSGATPSVSAAGPVDDEPTRRASGAGIVQRSLSFGKSAARAAAAALTPKPTEENTNDFLAASRARQERKAESPVVPPVAPPVAPEPPLVPMADLSPPAEVSAAPEPPAADASAPGSAMVAPELPSTAPAAPIPSAAAPPMAPSMAPAPAPPAPSLAAARVVVPASELPPDTSARDECPRPEQSTAAPPTAVSVISSTLKLDGDVSSFTPSVQAEIARAIAAEAGVDSSAVALTVTSGSVIIDMSIQTDTATADSVHLKVASATSSPSRATAMLSSVTGVSCTVLEITKPATLAAVTPRPAETPRAPVTLRAADEDDHKDEDEDSTRPLLQGVPGHKDEDEDSTRPLLQGVPGSSQLKPPRESVLAQMGLLESFGAKDKVSYEQLKDQTEDAIADAMELANDVQAKLANAKQELADAQALAAAKLEEGQALSELLQDKDAPLQLKVVKTLAFLNGPFLGCLKFVWRVFCCLLPLYEKLFRAAYFFYTWAPKKVMTMVFGVILCFFGGTYVASLAAVEAFRNMGGDRVIVDFLFVYNELKALNEVNEKDEAAAALNPDDDHKTADELFAEEKYACP